MSRPPSRRYPRTARVNRVVQEVVAEQLELVDDPRLGFVTVTDVEVGTDLREATVYYTWLPVGPDGAVLTGAGSTDAGSTGAVSTGSGSTGAVSTGAASTDAASTGAGSTDAGDDARQRRDAVLDVLAVRIHAELNRQVRLRHVPRLTFREDPGARAGARVEAILRDLRDEHHEHGQPDDEPDDETEGSPGDGPDPGGTAEPT